MIQARVRRSVPQALDIAAALPDCVPSTSPLRRLGGSILPQQDSDFMRELGIGRPIPRSEDLRLIQGRGRYTNDYTLAGECHMAVVRSPHAHAEIRGIDPAPALEAPGVIAVLTGADAEADGLGTIQTMVQRHKRDGSPMEKPPYPILARDRVRLAGDAVAIVLAETPGQARDAAELVAVEYEELPAVTDAAEAVKPGAPVLWPGLVPDNVAFVFQQGDRDAADRAIEAAEHVARLDFRISRVYASPLEPRAALASFDPTSGRYTLIAGVQGPHRLRDELAQRILRIPASKLRVISPDVGGAFGMKGSPFPEYGMALWAARRLGRPVRWLADRGESFLSDYHARDNVTTVELGLDGEGNFLGMRVRTIANLGAYLGYNTPHSPTNNLGGLAGTYRTPAIHVEVLGAYTNTQPTAPYRGAGRPEATYAIERAIDLAARHFGFDRVELRRRNLIRPDEMPFKTGLVFTYDSGEFEKNMDMALQLADWDGFEKRREEAAARGRLRGIGLSNPIEIAGGPQNQPMEEACEIRFDSSGSATFLMGTHNHGQGHENAFRQIAHDVLGLDPERVEILYGDTDLVPHGKGTFGSRSMASGGGALVRAAEKIVEKGRLIAANLLEADAADIEFSDGAFKIAGTDREVRIEEVAKASFNAARLPDGVEYGLIEKAIVAPEAATFPNGCHVCEVEIDSDTGRMEIVAYVVVDDVGRVINPLLLKGQIHGGIAQGAGQAVLEAIAYEPGSGQMVTGSFNDYAMPRADDLPSFVVDSNEVPTTKNPLGVKGAGEAGTVGSLVAVVNAAVDALKPLGVEHIEMPLTAQRLWQTIEAAKRTNG
jgi:aerobic carbon-monoxide dehydrogenase large subunit